MKNLLYLSFLFFSVLSFGQERTVTGNVTSLEDILPLPGAVIHNERTEKTVQSDLDGNYRIIANPDDILRFGYVARHSQRVQAYKTEINVGLEEDKHAPKEPSMYIEVRPLNNNVFIYKPNLAFKKNAENNDYIIFASELNSYIFSKEEQEFQKKYNVKYVFTIEDYNPEYIKKYNKLTFKYLNKKYKKSWQTEIRKDVIGLDEFLKRQR